MELKVSLPQEFKILEGARLVWLIFGNIDTIKQLAIMALSRNDIVMIASPSTYYHEPPAAPSENSNSETDSLPDQLPRYKLYELETETDLTEIEHAADMAATDSGFERKGERWNQVSCDVRELASVQEAVDKCLLLYGAINVVVNWMCREPNELKLSKALSNPRMDIESIEREGVIINNRLEAEVVGLYNMIKATLPQLKDSKPVVLAGGPDAAADTTSAVVPEEDDNNIQNFNEELKNPSSSGHTDDFLVSVSESASVAIPSKFITITNTLGIQAVPEFRAECTIRRAIEGMLESFAIEAAEQNVRSVMVDVGLGRFDGQRIADVVWKVGHSVDPFDRVLATENALQALRKRLRWMVEETEDWKYLFE